MPSQQAKGKAAKRRPGARKAVKRRDLHAASLADLRYRPRIKPAKSKARKPEIGFEDEIDDAINQNADD